MGMQYVRRHCTTRRQVDTGGAFRAITCLVSICSVLYLPLKACSQAGNWPDAKQKQTVEATRAPHLKIRGDIYGMGGGMSTSAPVRCLNATVGRSVWLRTLARFA